MTAAARDRDRDPDMDTQVESSRGGRLSVASAARYLGWIAIACLITYMVLVGGTYSGIGAASLRVAADGVITLTLGTWVVVAWRHPAWRPTTVLWPAIVAVLAAFAVSTVFAWNPRISADYLGYAVVCGALYLLLHRLLTHPFFGPRVLALAVVLAVVIDAAYIVAVSRDWIAWWQLVGSVVAPPLRPAGEALTFASPNIVATTAVLFTAVALAHVPRRGRGGTVAASALLFLTGLVVVLSGSRGSWLACAVAIVVTAGAWVLAWAAHRRERHFDIRRAATAPRIAVAFVALLVVAGAAVAVVPAVADRFAAGGADFRIGFVLAAWRMFQAAPLVGMGPGAWAVRRAAFTQASETDVIVPHAHNIYAQTPAEFGIVGVLAGIVLVASLAVLVVQGLRHADPARRRFAYAALFALTYLGVQQLVDFMVNLPGVMFGLAVIIARLDGLSDRPAAAHTAASPSSRAARRLVVRSWTAAAVAAVACAVTFLGWSDSVAVTGTRATQAADAGNPQAAFVDARSAVHADPSMPPYQFTLGVAAARIGQWQVARQALLASAAADQAPEAWLDVAAIDVQLGDRADATTALTRALRLGSQRTSILVPAAVLWLNLGDSASAQAAVTSAFAVAPALAGDRFWQSRADLSTTAAAAVDALVATAPAAVSWPVALYAGRLSVASQLAGGLPAGTGELARVVIRAWSGDPTASRALQAMAVRSPFDPSILTWCAALAERQGTQATVDRYQEWSLIVVDEPARPPAILSSRTADALVAGFNADWEAGAMYRRTWPANPFVPGLPLVVQP